MKKYSLQFTVSRFYRKQISKHSWYELQSQQQTDSVIHEAYFNKSYINDKANKHL